MSEPRERPRFILKRERRTLPVRLTPPEYVARGQQVGKVDDDLRQLDGQEKVSRAAFKERRETLESKRSTLCAVLRRGAEDRPVEVDIVADHERAKILEVRADTDEVLSERAMSQDERQGHLFPPVSTDAFDCGRLAASWRAEVDGRPEPANRYSPDLKPREWLRWECGFRGEPDPAELYTSPYFAGSDAVTSGATNPFVEGTLDHRRWEAGRAGKADPAGDELKGLEARYHAACAALMASGDGQARQAVEVWKGVDVEAPAEVADAAAWLRGRVLPAPQVDELRAEPELPSGPDDDEDEDEGDDAP